MSNGVENNHRSLPNHFLSPSEDHDESKSILFPLQDDVHGLEAGGSDWTNIIIPGEIKSSEFHHEKQFLLTDLQPDAQYECLVQAKNVYGWSEASRIHRFFTHSNSYGKKSY